MNLNFMVAEAGGLKAERLCPYPARPVPPASRQRGSGRGDAEAAHLPVQAVGGHALELVSFGLCPCACERVL